MRTRKNLIFIQIGIIFSITISVTWASDVNVIPQNMTDANRAVQEMEQDVTTLPTDVNQDDKNVKLQGASTDVAGFLLASGFGLLIVLLGWSEQITSKNKEMRELEIKFLECAKLKRKDYRKIVDEGGSTKESFSALIDFLYSQEREDDQIDIFGKIKLIKSNLKKLERKYSQRFWALFAMSILLFATGSLILFYPQVNKGLVLIPNLVFVAFLLFNLVDVRLSGSKYIKNIIDIMEKL